MCDAERVRAERREVVGRCVRDAEKNENYLAELPGNPQWNQLDVSYALLISVIQIPRQCQCAIVGPLKVLRKEKNGPRVFIQMVAKLIGVPFYFGFAL